MILAAHVGQAHLGQVNPIDVTADQIALAVGGSDRLIAQNFETAIVIRQIKRDINTLLGRPALGVVEPFRDTPADVAGEAIDPITLAAFREVLARLPKIGAIEAESAQELAILAPNQTAFGTQLIPIFEILNGLASELETLPPADTQLVTSRGIRPGTLVIGALVFMGLAGLGAALYYRETR